jgi:hypothetical protein
MRKEKTMNKTVKRAVYLLLAGSFLAGCGNPILRNALWGDDAERTGNGAGNSAIAQIEYKYQVTAAAEEPPEDWNDPVWISIGAAAPALNAENKYLWCIWKTSYSDGTDTVYEKKLETTYGAKGTIEGVDYLYQVNSTPAPPPIPDDAAWESGTAWQPLVDEIGDLTEEKPYLWFAQKTSFKDKGPAYKVGLQAMFGYPGSEGQDVPVIWKGEAASPGDLGVPQRNWAYYNTTDGRIYIYDGSGWLPAGSTGTP